MDSEAAAVLYSFLSILGTWAIWVLLFRDYRADSLRHSLRMLHDECFDQAASGAILPSDPAYQQLKKLISEAAANAHRITFTRVLAASLFLRLRTEKFDLSMDEGSGTALDPIRARMADLILSHALGVFSSRWRHHSELAGLVIASAASGAFTRSGRSVP